MKQLSLFFETRKGKRVKNVIIGVGAAVVLLGALFKLQHWTGAGAMLTIGLCTEAFIFTLQGILPPHKDYYWEKMYPDLDISPEEEESLAEAGMASKGSLTQQLDEMLDESKVEKETIFRLGKNLERLSTSVESIGEVSDSAVYTNEYAEKARAASQALGQMTTAYSNATESVNALAGASSATVAYHEQVQQLSKNLATLNSMYELELQDTNNHLKAMNKFYGGLTDAMNNLNESLEDAQSYKEEMAKLAKNLRSLNGVYGNMLSAMAVPGGHA